jgi:replication initiation and membrane attachment protein DnaB
MEDGHSNAGSKDYLVSLMFSHYDLNNNGLLEAQELSKVYYDYTYRSSYIELLRPLSISFFSFSPFHSWRIIQMIPASSRVPGFPKQLRDD